MTDNKPKLFKAPSSGPFAKRSAPTTTSNFGGNSAPKNDGLFYPGGSTTTQAKPDNQFSSITSFGARNNTG